MEWFKVFQRVYILIGPTYDLRWEALASLDLTDLICEVAKANPTGDIEPLYDEIHGTVFERRTKKFIVRRVDRFVAGIPEIFSPDENMANFASLTQLNCLIRAFDDTSKKQISCYSLVYVYVIYTLLEGKSAAAETCAAYLIELHELVLHYFEDHPDDEVAKFIDGCFGPIMRAVSEKDVTLSYTGLPPRPRNRPVETNE